MNALITLFAMALRPKVAPPQVVSIDAAQFQMISPYIYGCNSPDWKTMDIGFTAARQGGNRMTAYNWETNASNAGNDWYNHNDGFMGQTDEPGWTVRTFLEPTQAHNALAIITVPILGYVSADKDGTADVNATPDYLNKRFYKSYANKPGGQYQYPPDTTDKAVYQDEFVHWLLSIAKPTPPIWFDLDNEPDIWHGTHSRICLQPETYAGIISKDIDYAAMIKKLDPSALVLGPVNYGWQGFMSFQNAPDANGRNFVDVYLDAMKAAAEKYGKRLIDAYDFHWYPEAKGGGVRVSDETSNPAVDAARVQAPRSLWDPTYVEDSWISDSIGHKPLALLPAMQRRVDEHYPGTRLAITEYNYGGGKSISGAIAQADVLGIFGRYGILTACNWGLNAGDVAEMAGFAAFTDYDKKGSKFGDRELTVAGVDPALGSVYASTFSTSPKVMTIVVIDKGATELPFELQLSHFKGKTATAYTVTSNSLGEPTVSNVEVDSGGVRLTAPPMSVTTIRIDS